MTTAPRPPPKSPLATARPWDLVADGYAAEILPMFAPYAEAALALAVLPPGARIADVACGPGTLALLAAARGIHVDALDVAPEMVGRLRAISSTRGLVHVLAVVGDGQALPWPDARFEAVFSLFGLMYFADRAEGLRELVRVLAPGGRAVISSWPPVAEAPVLARVLAALGEAEPSFAGPSRAVLSTPEELEAELAQAGLRSVRVERVAPPTPFANARAFWAHLQRSSAPMNLARLGVGEDRWRSIAAHVDRTLDTVYGTEPIDVVLPAWVAIGTKP